MPAHRRDFLRSSLAASTLVSMGAATVPGFLGRSARAADGVEGERPGPRRRPAARRQRRPEHGRPARASTATPEARRALRLAAGQIHKITNEIGLHPAMGGMAKLLEDGQARGRPGGRLPNPDRSHFRSMEIWETARLEPGAARDRLARPGARRRAGHARRRPAGAPRRRRGRCRWP